MRSHAKNRFATKRPSFPGKGIASLMPLALLALAAGCEPQGGHEGDGDETLVVQQAVVTTEMLTRAVFNNSGNGGPFGSYLADNSAWAANGTKNGPVPATINRTGLTDPAPEGVYKSGRSGTFRYTVPGFAAGMNSRIRLHFAEVGGAPVGQRKFAVFINGSQVLDQFDIRAVAGDVNKANIQPFTRPANANGEFVIEVISQTLPAYPGWLSGFDIQPPAACAGGAAADQTFGSSMVGCKGSVDFSARASLCAAGYRVATATEWATFNGGTAPTYNYWTDDFLGFSGTSANACAATTPGVGTGCTSPMHVCTPSGTDTLNNACGSLTHCGLDSKGPDLYFGGCGYPKAGTLCVRNVCANGEADQVFRSGMIGCRGSSSWAASNGLCATDQGYHEATAEEWTEFNGGITPAYNYWVSDPVLKASGTAGACTASHFTGTDQSVRMHVCTPTGTDSLGNACGPLLKCGFMSSTNRFFGGGATGFSAGALCVHGNPPGCFPGTEGRCAQFMRSDISSTSMCGGVPWAKGTVFYQLMESDACWRDQVRVAMNHWQTVTENRIIFEENTTNASRLQLYCSDDRKGGKSNCPAGGQGGASDIGYAVSGSRIAKAHIFKSGTSTEHGCSYGDELGWMTHELGHALGLLHEQERSDRDRYTYMNPATFLSNADYDTFAKCGPGSPGSDFGRYDATSTMQYETRNANDLSAYQFHRYDMLTPVNSDNNRALANKKDAANVVERYAALRAWTKFVSLGRDVGEHMPLQVAIPSPPAPALTPISGRPAVASGGGFGNVDVYVRGHLDKHIYRRYMVNGAWVGWEDLGATFDSEPAAAGFAPANSVVLAVRSRQIYWNRLANAAWSGWLQLPELPAPIAPGSGPAVVARGPNNLVAFYRATDNSVYQSELIWAWSSWVPIPPALAGMTFSASPGAAARGLNTYDVFMTTTDGRIVRAAFDNAWKTPNWEVVATNAKPDFSPAAASRGTGRVEVFYRGNNDWLYGRRWEQVWRPIEPLGHLLNSSPAVVAPHAGRLEVYAIGQDLGLWRRIHQPARNDFDGDGKADMAVFRSSDNRWHIRQSSNNLEKVGEPGVSTDRFVPADYDGDGRTDRGVYRNGSWLHAYSLNSISLPSIAWGSTNDRPSTGDYDADGLADFAYFRPSTGHWFILPGGSTGGYIDISFGANGDNPVPADYDGDGVTDIAYVHPNDWTWHIRASGPTPIADLQWGQAGDIAVPADYDGDGKVDRAIYRTGTRDWWIWRSIWNDAVSYNFGNTNVVPQPADYDGDGKADLAYFNKTDGKWYVQASSGISFAPVAFQAADKPVTVVNP